jgi:deoxyribodipyrimidine photo-lyase
MRRILWFRRDLRVHDNPLLSLEGEVFPIFIFDKNILHALGYDDRRVTFIYERVLQLQKELQTIGLDLKIYHATPLEVFTSLDLSEFDEVVASGDYDAYAKERDRAISQLIHFRYLSDTYIFKPKEILKEDASPYLVFTPFYKKAKEVLKFKNIAEISRAKQRLMAQDYSNMQISLESLGFSAQKNCEYLFRG